MRRNWVLVMASISMLAGCATPAETYNTLREQQHKEDMGWQSVAANVESVCGYNADDNRTKIEKEKVVEQARCTTGLVNQYVMPVAAFPNLVAELRSNIETASVDFYKNKISEPQYKSTLDGIWKNYHSNWVWLANDQIGQAETNQQNALMWAGAISSAGASSYQYRQDALQQQAKSRAAYEANRPKSVVCRPLGYGGRVECYEQ